MKEDKHRVTPYDGKKVFVVDKDHPHHEATAICIGAELTSLGWAMKFKNVNTDEEFYVFKGSSIRLVN